ncbi:hypothetical protein ACH4S9_36995 [Streptomyces sp. NPDC021225]|uniref:hypothetical protein n=1 Tax=Streptomyces sp. NPDC021225 TaxID=3365121 RepID=UPI003791E82B
MNRALLTTRSALILLLAILCGIGAAILTGSAGASPSKAVLSGVAAFGFAVPFFNTLIE